MTLWKHKSISSCLESPLQPLAKGLAHGGLHQRCSHNHHRQPSLCTVSLSQSLTEGLCPPRQPRENPCHPALRSALGLQVNYHAVVPPHSLRWLMSPSSLPLLSQPRSAHTFHPPEQGGTTLPSLCPLLLPQLFPVSWISEQSPAGFPFIRDVWGIPSPSP